MATDAYTIIISGDAVTIDSSASVTSVVPVAHADSHYVIGGSDLIPTATASSSGLMSPAIYQEHVLNTAKVTNQTHTGDATGATSLTVVGLQGILFSNRPNGFLGVNSGTVTVTASADLAAAKLIGGQANQIVYQTGVGQTGFIPTGSTGQVLTVGVSGAPSWSNPATAVSATNLAGGLTGQIPYQANPGQTSFVAAGSTGQSLVVDNSGLPVWASSVARSTNIADGQAGQIPYQVAANQTGFVAVGSVGQLLVSNGSGAPSWADPSSIPVAPGSITTSALADSSSSTTGVTLAKIQYLDAGSIIGRAVGAGTGPATSLTFTSRGYALLNSTNQSSVLQALGLGEPIGPAYGGTGLSTYTANSLLYASGPTTLNSLQPATAGNVLVCNGSGVAPSWGFVDLSSSEAVTNVLPVANGGTGSSTAVGAANNLLPSQTGLSPNSVLVSNGSSLSWFSGGLVPSQMSQTGYLKTNGTDASWQTIDLTDSTVTNVLPASKGGTGVNTLTGFINSLLPSQSGNSGKFLTTDSNNVSWATVSIDIPETEWGMVWFDDYDDFTGFVDGDNHILMDMFSALSSELSSANVDIQSTTGRFGFVNTSGETRLFKVTFELDVASERANDPVSVQLVYNNVVLAESICVTSSSTALNEASNRLTLTHVLEVADVATTAGANGVTFKIGNPEPYGAITASSRTIRVIYPRLTFSTID